MGLIALDISEVRRYILREEQNDPNPTIFLLGHIPPMILAKIEDSKTEYRLSTGRNGRSDPDATADAYPRLNERNIEIVRNGLKGWENFVDRDGKPVPFTTISKGYSGISPRMIADDVAMSRLKMEWITELAEAIINYNTYTEREKKILACAFRTRYSGKLRARDYRDVSDMISAGEIELAIATNVEAMTWIDFIVSGAINFSTSDLEKYPRRFFDAVIVARMEYLRHVFPQKKQERH